MNWDEIEGKWKQFKGKIKEKWGKLTNDDLDFIAGKKDQLIGKLQERYGYMKDRAESEADSFASSCGACDTSTIQTPEHRRAGND